MTDFNFRGDYLDKVLLHCCCAPCSVSCVGPLLEEGFSVTAFWYNPNIHPFKEYEARRDCFVNYMQDLNIPVVVDENYGLRQFVENVAENIDGRCVYCYTHRLEQTAKYAAENGFSGFTSTLFASIYQNHEFMKQTAEKLGEKYGVKFIYRDFRANFREGNKKARDMGLYMQKYCGCIFSEEERYQKQIERDKERFL